MLEFNLYNNFNPNLALSSSKLPSVKARGVAMNYELWQTGYKYTSTAVLSIKAEIGDVVEVLLTESYTIATAQDKIESKNLSLFYVVTDIDNANKATLKNYFWAMIDGLDIPTSVLSGSSLSVFNLLTNKKTTALISDSAILNANELAQTVKYNRKSDTDNADKVAKDLFRVVRMQPFVVVDEGLVKTVLVSRTWSRQVISTRIDDKQNPTFENETLIQRSKYNFLNVYVKSNGVYPQIPLSYTIDDDNNVINLASYIGDGSDLPTQRLVKSAFFDEQPQISEIKSQITSDTTVSNVYFNQNELMPLVVNDLIDLYYQGSKYSGYIADRVFIESDGALKNERLLFVEGGNS